MELKGKIILIKDTETFNKGFKKRQIVVETDSKYPQTIPVEFTQDKCVILDNYQVGQFVTISINILGSEWQGKYYANIQGWKIDKGEQEMSSSSFMPDRQSINNMMENAESIGQEDDDDLPF